MYISVLYWVWSCILYSGVESLIALFFLWQRCEQETARWQGWGRNKAGTYRFFFFSLDFFIVSCHSLYKDEGEFFLRSFLQLSGLESSCLPASFSLRWNQSVLDLLGTRQNIWIALRLKYRLLFTTDFKVWCPSMCTVYNNIKLHNIRIGQGLLYLMI